MKILAFETSTTVCSIALLHDEQLIAEHSLASQNSHSELLLNSVDQLLTSCKLDITDIDLYAAACGPGSFTGLRVSLSTIKALAHANKKKTVGVSTLEALSLNGAHFEGVVCPLIDARQGQFYTAAFSFSKDLHPARLFEDCILTLDDIVKKCPPKKPILMLGNGPTYLSQPRAAHVGLLASRLAKHGKASDPEYLRPNYIRQPAAQVNLKKSR